MYNGRIGDIPSSDPLRFSQAFLGVVLHVVDVPTTSWEHSWLRERKHDLLLQWCVPPFSVDFAGSDVNVEF
jgi:hypothetical protein